MPGDERQIESQTKTTEEATAASAETWESVGLVVDPTNTAASEGAAKTEAQVTPEESETKAETESAGPEPIPPDVLAMAEEYGLSSESAAALGPARTAQFVLRAARRERAADDKPSAETKKETTSADDDASVVQEFAEELPDNRWDEEAAQDLKKLAKWASDQIRAVERKAKERAEKAVEAKIQPLVQEHERRAMAEFETAMDAFFAAETGPGSDLFGTEPVKDLNPDSPKMAARRQLVEKMNSLNRAHLAETRRPMPLRDLYDAARVLRFPELFKPKSASAPAIPHTNRPAQRASKDETPEQRAYRHAEEITARRPQKGVGAL